MLDFLRTYRAQGGAGGYTNSESMNRSDRAGNNQPREYRMEDGKRYTLKQLAAHPANYSGLTVSGIRNRLQRGINTFDELFQKRWS